MHRVFDPARSDDGSRKRRRRCCLPPPMTASAPRLAFTRLNSPACAYPYRRLAAALAGGRRTARGRRDSLDLRRRAFSSPSPGRFIPALSIGTTIGANIHHRCWRSEAHARARAIPRQLLQSRVAITPDTASRLLVVVQLSSERARQAVRQDCSFATKQESRPALPVFVRSARLRLAMDLPGSLGERASRAAAQSVVVLDGGPVPALGAVRGWWIFRSSCGSCGTRRGCRGAALWAAAERLHMLQSPLSR
jgi:hypothetical protein